MLSDSPPGNAGKQGDIIKTCKNILDYGNRIYYDRKDKNILFCRKGNERLEKKHRCRELFLTFLKIGAFTFGGGYAMIPLIKREILEKKGWIDEKEMLDIVAVAESTPGPLAINMATFVGSRMAGTAGAFFATAGVVLPSFLIILLISFFLKQIEEIKVVKYAFAGIRIGVLVLILNTFLSLCKQIKREWFTCLLMAGAFVCVALFDVSAVAVLIVCGAAGMIRNWRKGRVDSV